jgi:toxin ParE1/3/4
MRNKIPLSLRKWLSIGSQNSGSVPSELEGISEMLCRQIVIKNYRIIYQILGQVVILHGIIDGRRNLRETMRQRILI